MPLAACARVLARADLDRVVCLCADGGERYASTIFDDGWLARHGIDAGRLELGPVEAIAPARRLLAAAV